MISPGMSSCEHSLNTLRYADRVKELAANDPMEMKTSPSSEGEPMKMEDNGVLDDSDLAQLRSLNVILTLNVIYFLHHCHQCVCFSRVKTERDGTRAETRFGLPVKWTSPFILAGVSVQSSTGFLGVRVGGERL